MDIFQFIIVLGGGITLGGASCMIYNLCCQNKNKFPLIIFAAGLTLIFLVAPIVNSFICGIPGTI